MCSNLYITSFTNKDKQMFVVLRKAIFIMLKYYSIVIITGGIVHFYLTEILDSSKKCGTFKTSYFKESKFHRTV